jgi:hypothetical protein
MSAIPFYIQYGIQGEENAKYFVEVRGEIIGILKQSETGAKTSELCRQHGISTATFYGWRSKYGGLEVSVARPPGGGIHCRFRPILQLPQTPDHLEPRLCESAPLFVEQPSVRWSKTGTADREEPLDKLCCLHPDR